MGKLASNWAYNQVKAKPDIKMILVAMADHADDFGMCWPGIALLADKSGVSTKTIKRKIKQLVEFNVLSKFSRCSGYHKTTNKYRLHVERSFNLMECKSWRRFPVEWGQLDPTQHNAIDEAVLSGAAGEGALSRDSLSPLAESSRDNLSPSIGTKSPHSNSPVGTLVVPISRDTSCPPNTYRNIDNIDNNELNNLYSKIPPTEMVTISIKWKPSKTAYDWLENLDNIEAEFITSCIPGFIFYWLGRKDKNRKLQSSFDGLFLKHARVNYRKFQAEPKPIPDDWQPDPEVLGILQDEGIPPDDIDEKVLRFRVYWRDRGELRHAWSSVFLSWCIEQFERSGGSSHVSN